MRIKTIFFALACSFAPTVLCADCSFCNPKIIDAQAVFEGEHLRVLVDYAPCAYGHLLIMTKRHVQKFHELLPEEINELLPLVQKTVGVFQKVLQTDNYLVLEKNGGEAWQSVPHVHFHLLPVDKKNYKSKKYSTIIKNLFNRATPLDKHELQKVVKTFKDAFQTQP